jgi:hypothetical protein
LGARERRYRKRLDEAVQEVVHVRPGFMKASPGQKNAKSYHTFFAWIYPVGRALYPAGFCTLQEVGRAMINAAGKGFPKQVLDVNDIVMLSRV